ncbi:unnamed protein product [marine sediment metagenome]|uniref:Uncharacterized protein n=1 Tax=marine sediment metagenome TaxID=412755 RepID=X0W2Z7_9ZZZZ
MTTVATISAAREIADSLTAFVTAESFALNVSCEGPGEVKVVKSAGRDKSDVETIQSGGWIECPTALAMAGRLGISTRQMGAILDFLEVKIRKCALGCFE